MWQSLPHDHVDQLAEIGISAGLGDAFLRVGYIKAFMDGTLGSQTARMLDGTGVEITSRETLVEILRRAAPAGWPVAVHAIGDLANREALDAFEETRGEWAPLGLRNRIEHAQLLAPEDLGRFADLGVAAEEVGFVDDSAANVDAARRVGIRAVRHDPTSGAQVLRREVGELLG